jgi:hypothetical protein
MTFTIDIKHSSWVFDIFRRGTFITLRDPQSYVILSLSDPVLITLTAVGAWRILDDCSSAYIQALVRIDSPWWHVNGCWTIINLLIHETPLHVLILPSLRAGQEISRRLHWATLALTLLHIQKNKWNGDIAFRSQ